ncbi:hypothetical protein [Haloarcula amylolytica]|uniref:Uncharacterized protein n=1 Tax=Haloarcula amylolytica JCM 13557 TaxID=1227452 RepID=M0KFK5_9EURY|nr:hypothetical protein [Haloarcula amylolytica]EMA19643.1 hypothetical protein C442_14040 [Haloarcula amylolytica JCM 13557]
MNRTLVAVMAAVVLLAGTAMATGAFIDGDEVAPDRNSGVYLAPADTVNGDQYAEYDETGQLRISLSPVLPNGQTRVDDLFVVGFAGYEGTDSAATVELDSEPETVRMYRMDTGAQVAGDTVSLEPDESVRFGLAVTPAERNFTGTISITAPVPEQQSTEGDESNGGSGGGSTGGGGGSVPPSDDDGSGTQDGGDPTTPTPTPTDSNSTNGTANDDGNETETAAGGGSGGSGTGVGTSTDERAETPTTSEEEPETVAGGGAEPVPTTPESQQSAEPNGFTLGFEPAFGISWGPWAVIAGLLAVVTNYLVQTRYHDVLPVLQTQPSDRRRRFRRVAVRETAIGLAGIVLTVLVVAAASGAGFGPVSQLVAALAFSAAVGTGTGYRLVPELDALPELQAADGGTEEQ